MSGPVGTRALTGTVCLQGGGEFSAACGPMDTSLLVDAEGPVVVAALAGAQGSEYRTANANGVRHFESLGARSVLAAPDVREDPEAALVALRSASVLVLPGGSPARLLEALQGTAAGEVVAGLLASGGVVMGASAGAMVLCAWTVLPERGMRVVPGLGLVPDVVVVPHWSGGRSDWLRAIDLDVPADVTVLGLPEESGVVVRDGQVRAVGRLGTHVIRECRDLPVGQSLQPVGTKFAGPTQA